MNPKNVGVRRRQAPRRVLRVAFFLVALLAACAFLSPFVTPKGVDAALKESKKAVERLPQVSVRWDDDRATVTGRGRIADDSAQGRALARRAALTDARRNILILRSELLPAGDRLRLQARTSVSGRVGPAPIRSERVEGSFYLVELEVVLSALVGEGDVLVPFQ